jgi:hypothetical protein
MGKLLQAANVEKLQVKFTWNTQQRDQWTSGYISLRSACHVGDFNIPNQAGNSSLPFLLSFFARTFRAKGFDAFSSSLEWQMAFGFSVVWSRDRQGSVMDAGLRRLASGWMGFTSMLLLPTFLRSLRSASPAPVTSLSFHKSLLEQNRITHTTPNTKHQTPSSQPLAL